MSALERAKQRLARRQKNLKAAKKKVAWLIKRVANTKATIKRLRAKPAVWHPGARRDPYTDAGPFTTGLPKLVWHTTEGTSLPRYAGSAPHFTLNPRTGELWQHIPIDRAAKALRHPAGTPETNKARAIQVELIGFAGTTQDWSDGEYARIASLARWIEPNARVPRKCTVTFTGSNVSPRRLSWSEWMTYTGHLGHQHVPANDHWDPGRFDIDRIV
jgi:hypothetical protein